MGKTTAAALLLFAILSLVLTYPLALHLGDAVEDRQDALLNVWITAWDGHQLLDDPLHLFDANIFHTYARTLAYSELLLGNGLLAIPITSITGNPVLGYNVALMLSFVLAGFGTYLLVLKLTSSPGPGLVAGTIFAFSSYQMSNLAQAQLLTVQWIPLALLSLHQLMRQPRPRHVATFVLFFCLQALSSFYYGMLLALAALGFVMWELVVGKLAEWGRGKGEPGNGHLEAGYGSRGIHLLVAALCCALVISPFALPYFQVQQELGFERTLADNEPFSASLKQYLMVPSNNVAHSRWLPSDDTPIAGGYPVDALFPGLVALGLSLWGLIRGRGRTRWFFLLLLLASLVLSLGPRLYLAPGEPAELDLKLPYAWLYASIPGFKALRAPVRFDALVTLSLSVLAGYGVATLRRAWIPALLVGLVVVESLTWPAAKTEPVPMGDQVPAVYRWLADRPSGAILELPMAFTRGGPQLEYQYLSTYHWHTTPDGYSGFIPAKHGQIVYEMERFPSERSVRLLQALEVRYVVIHTDRYPAEQGQQIEKDVGQAEDLTPAEIFGTDHVYELASFTFDPENLDVSTYLPPKATAGATYIAFVIVLNNSPWSYAVQPTDLLHPTAIWRAGEGSFSETVSADVPQVTSGNGGASVIPVPLTAPNKPGLYDLSIGEQEGPLGRWSAGSTVEVREEGDGVGAFPVPARLVAGSVPATAQPGEPLPVDLTWQALGKIDAYYSVSVKLLDAGGKAIATWDGQPRNGEAPTLTWVPGERIEDTVVLSVADDALPGDYFVEVGMYRAKDLARCLLLDEEGMLVDRVSLGTVHIGP